MPSGFLICYQCCPILWPIPPAQKMWLYACEWHNTWLACFKVHVHILHWSPWCSRVLWYIWQWSTVHECVVSSSTSRTVMSPSKYWGTEASRRFVLASKVPLGCVFRVQNSTGFTHLLITFCRLNCHELTKDGHLIVIVLLLNAWELINWNCVCVKGYPTYKEKVKTRPGGKHEGL